MKKDFDLIVKKFPTNCNQINIYPVGDMQVGSAHFDERLWSNWKNTVMNDPIGYVVMVGDTTNNGIKRSKTNSYGEVLRPRQQKEWLKRELGDLKDKMIGAVRGNHEERSVNETDDCPLYDAMCKHDLEDLYRENMAFIKINLGQRTSERQVSYVIVLGHGVGGFGKTKRFSYMVDGMDVFITGHIHEPMSRFPAKIVVDTHNEVVRKVGFKHIIVPSFDYGGYQLRDMYDVQDGSIFPIIHLNGEKKEVAITWK